MLFKNFKRDPGPYVFAMFALTGGFLEAFTFLLHGGVFCNAQTGNLVMLVINFVGGDFYSGLRYLYSILAYNRYTYSSVAIPLCLRRVNLPLAVTAAEIAVLAALAFIPESVPDWVTYATVSFVCAVQYNTFTTLRGQKLATTFCTNNLRQTVMHFAHGVAERASPSSKRAAYMPLSSCVLPPARRLVCLPRAGWATTAYSSARLCFCPCSRCSSPTAA